MSRRTEHETVFVVIRVDFIGSPPHKLDNELGPAVRFDGYRVTAKQVLTTAEEAEREVLRLNALNAGKSCRYYWTGSRYFSDGGSFGSGPVSERNGSA